MPPPRLDLADRREHMIALYSETGSLAKVAEAMGVSRYTVTVYLKETGVPVNPKGKPRRGRRGGGANRIVTNQNNKRQRISNPIRFLIASVLCQAIRDHTLAKSAKVRHEAGEWLELNGVTYAGYLGIKPSLIKELISYDR